MNLFGIFGKSASELAVSTEKTTGSSAQDLLRQMQNAGRTKSEDTVKFSKNEKNKPSVKDESNLQAIPKGFLPKSKASAAEVSDLEISSKAGKTVEGKKEKLPSYEEAVGKNENITHELDVKTSDRELVELPGQHIHEQRSELSTTRSDHELVELPGHHIHEKKAELSAAIDSPVYELPGSEGHLFSNGKPYIH